MLAASVVSRRKVFGRKFTLRNADTGGMTNAYDAVPYPNLPHREAHPRQMELIATLFGLGPKPIQNCRVLELGCAAGWNLIPQAQEYPSSRFVGVDLSRVQIDEGRALAQALGLDNLELREASITDIDVSWGKFDYIICHGVFSWVLPEVQRKILAVARQNLTPNGVALISYNVYPGWHFRGLVRDAMLYHAARFREAEQQIHQARAVLSFLHDNTPNDSFYHQMLGEEMKMLSNAPDSYLFHDHLERENRPLYFHQFAGLAQEHGLQYLGESNYAEIAALGVPQKARTTLESLTYLEREQYIDFLRIRGFRSTLLCHAEAEVNRTLKPADFTKLHVAYREMPEPFVFLHGELKVKFATKGVKLVSRSPLVRAALEYLKEVWPKPIAYEELVQAAARRLVSEMAERDSDLDKDYVDAAEVSAVLSILMQAFSWGVLDAFVTPPQFAPAVSMRPVASPVARRQAAQSVRVTNRRHEVVTLDVFSQQVIQRLDGAADRSMLVDHMQRALNSKKIVAKANATTPMSLEKADVGLVVDQVLNQLRQSALLVD
jgi:methyltransferase-like protein/2-polyprenyl-3-methyl-5-hydroxy-6-metoxy-1,4-benzoquinol methylase